MKLRKSRLSKIIKLRKFLGAFLGKFADVLKKDVVIQAKIFLPLLVTMVSASTIDSIIQRNIREQGVARAKKRNMFSHFR